MCTPTHAVHNFPSPPRRDAADVEEAPPRTPFRSIAGHGTVHELRPGVDAALEIVQTPEPVTAEVLRRRLAPDSVVALKDYGRVPIQAEQVVVARLVEESRALDLRDLPFGFSGRAGMPLVL